MSVQVYEQRPYAIDAVQFTGDNAAEIGTFLGVDAPSLQADDTGTYITVSIATYYGVIDFRVNVTDWVWSAVVGASSSVMADADFKANYRLASTP